MKLQSEHSHHWQTETPTGGRMRCECGTFYLNDRVVEFQKSDIQFVGPDLPDVSTSAETIQQATYAEERRVLESHPGEWTMLVSNIGHRDQTTATAHTSRRRQSAKEAGVGDKFRFSQRITYRNPDNFYDSTSAVFGRYYPEGRPA